MSNPETVNGFEQSTSQSLSVVCIIESYEAKKGAVKLPYSRMGLFNPMSRDSEIPICV
jgi:hypothetical protein